MDVEANDLVKTYPAGVRALDGLNLDIEQGEVFGLLGPNGAGKSTAIKILTTLTRPDSGRATVAGADVLRHPDQVRRCIGVVAQRSGTDPMASGRDNLLLQGRLYGMSGSAAAAAGGRTARPVRSDRGGRTGGEDLLGWHAAPPRRGDRVGPPAARALPGRADDRARSGGPHGACGRRSTGSPGPTDSPSCSRRTTWRKPTGSAGGWPLWTVAGWLSPEHLTRSRVSCTAMLSMSCCDTNQPTVDVRRAVGRLPGVREVTVSGRNLSARADDGAAAVPGVLAALDRAGAPAATVTVARPSLDDVYLRHVGRRFAETD